MCYDARGKLCLSGWQFQKNSQTVQAKIENAIRVFLSKSLDSDFEVRLHASGRTDSGVRARMQVAHFDLPLNLQVDPNRFVFSVNSILKELISIYSLEEVSFDFDARRTPHLKTYRYHFLVSEFDKNSHKNTSFWISSVDIKSMINASKYLQGKHDFSAFRASDCSAKTSTRIIKSIEFDREGDLLILSVVGNGFLKQMIRIIAGTLLEVGQGKKTAEEVEEILKSRDRLKAGPTAPAKGLELYKVEYLLA